MGRRNFDSDFSKEAKVTRLFAICEAALFFISLLVILLSASNSLVLVVALVGFLGAVSFLLYSWILYSALPLVQQKKQLKTDFRLLKGHVGQLGQELQKRRSEEEALPKQEEDALELREAMYQSTLSDLSLERERLPSEEEQERIKELNRLQREHYKEGVSQNPVSSARIQGIGPKTIQKVTRHGVTSIEDLNYSRLVSIHGIGEKTAQDFLIWGQSIKNRIIATQPVSLPPDLDNLISKKYSNQLLDINERESQQHKNVSEDKKAIRSEYATRQSENLRHQARLQEDIRDQTTKLDSLLSEVETYSDITYINYLKSSAFSEIIPKGQKRGWQAFLPLVLIIGTLWQVASGLVATGDLYVASLPTPTSTPTATYTATRTYTPSNTATFTLTLTPSLTFTPSSTFTPSITPSPSVTLPTGSQFTCLPSGNRRELGYVISVVDGDTINVRINGKDYEVQYIGIDSPEIGDYYGYNAYLRNSQLLSGGWVTLIKDISDVDSYDRLLRYVVSGNSFVNYQLVAEGIATARNYPPDSSCSALFSSGMSNAKSQMVGIWLPTVTPRPTSPPVTSGGGGGTNSQNCSPAYPTVCVPPSPPDLDCPDIPYRNFAVPGVDPHRFDGDNDGIGCEG